MRKNYLYASLLLLVLTWVNAPAIVIQLDYSYDTNGFFEQPGSKEAMRKAADLFEALIEDSFLPIDPQAYPGNGNTWTAWVAHPGTGGFVNVVDLIVPEDTVIIFVGGRTLNGPIGLGGPGGISGGGGSPEWVNAVTGRGQSGARSTPATDFAPWGGTIAFNSQSNWHFNPNGRPFGSSAYDFVSTALHELGHVFGIGTAQSWDAQISANQFQGSRSVSAFGGPVPLTNDNSHWRDDGNCPYDPNGVNNIASYTYGSFGTEHGSVQIALLDPQSCLVPYETTLRVLTDLDLAALADIGWELRFPFHIELEELGPGTSSLRWLSNTGASATLQRAAEPDGPWFDVALATAGDGTRQLVTDPNAPQGKAFYRLSKNTSSLSSSSSLIAPRQVELQGVSEADPGNLERMIREPIMIYSCSVCADCLPDAE